MRRWPGLMICFSVLLLLARRTVHGRRPKGIYACLFFAVFLAFTLIARAAQEAGAELDTRLRASVTNFDNRRKPLMQTLVEVARRYRLPMGIEKVDSWAVQEPVVVLFERGTVRQLLDTCVRQAPGYSWATSNGAVDIFGAEERDDPANLLNTLAPHFAARDEALPQVNYRLRVLMTSLRPNSGDERPAGIIRSYPWNPDHSAAKVTIEADDATIRALLNGLVSPFAGRFLWIARVPSDRLSSLPSAGLWQIVGPEIDDPTPLLDLGDSP